MPNLLFERVVIVGPGLIGGSLGQALRAGGLARRVVGVGHRQVSMDRALDVGAVDEATLDLIGAVPEADLVVLATGVGQIPEQAAAIIPHMKRGAILTDVGSVKGAICRATSKALAESAHATLRSSSLRSTSPSVRFVGGHPLAGSEQRGIDAARGDLFRGARCILTPTPETDRNALASVRAVWEAVGCRVQELSPERHDQLMAEMSHLPHAVAACLVNGLSDDAFALVATGFMDTTRVASGDPGLWADICMANRDALGAAVRVLADELKQFADRVDGADREEILAFLARAQARRDARL